MAGHRQVIIRISKGSQKVLIYNFVITTFYCQGGGISGRALALARPGVAPPLRWPRPTRLQLIKSLGAVCIGREGISKYPVVKLFVLSSLQIRLLQALEVELTQNVRFNARQNHIHARQPIIAQRCAKSVIYQLHEATTPISKSGGW